LILALKLLGQKPMHGFMNFNLNRPKRIVVPWEGIDFAKLLSQNVINF